MLSAESSSATHRAVSLSGVQWRFIVGVVPPTFPLTWVGAAESWGYIGGTGGKCFNVGAR